MKARELAAMIAHLPPECVVRISGGDGETVDIVDKIVAEGSLEIPTEVHLLVMLCDAAGDHDVTITKES